VTDIDPTTTTTLRAQITPENLPQGDGIVGGQYTTTMPVETTVGATTSPPSGTATTAAPASTTTTTVPLAPVDEDRSLQQVANETAAIISGIGTATQTAIDFNLGPLDYLQAPLGLEAATQRGQIVQPVEGVPGVNELITVFRFNPEYASNPALRQFESEMRNVTQSVLQSSFAPGVQGQYLPPAVIDTRDFVDVGRGDRYATEADVFQLLNSFSVNELANYKNQLVSMGLITKNQRGLMQQKEINDEVWRASLRVAEAANVSGIKYLPFIEQAISSGYQFAVPKDTGPKIPPLRLTSRDDIAYTANQIAAQRIGRSLNEAEIDAFMTSYNDMERKFHTDYYSGRAEVEDAPQVASAAQTMVREELQQESEVYRMGQYLDAFRQMMGGRR